MANIEIFETGKWKIIKITRNTTLQTTEEKIQQQKKKGTH